MVRGKTNELAAGDYSVTEEVLAGQSVGPVAIACKDNTGPIGGFAGDSADISLQAYQDISCTFTNDTIYWITANTDGNGTVSCSPNFVGKGASSTCTAVPDPGFQVKEWTGACAGMGSSTECYLSKISEDKTSTVVFVDSKTVLQCDINGDGRHNWIDRVRFKRGCGLGVATWLCDLNGDGRYNWRDALAYERECRVQRCN